MYSGGAQMERQLTVLDVELPEPQVLCQVKLRVAQLPSEPWDAANCMQLQVIRWAQLAVQVRCGAFILVTSSQLYMSRRV